MLRSTMEHLVIGNHLLLHLLSQKYCREHSYEPPRPCSALLRARLRPWPGGPAAPVGCNLPCLWSWPASEPGFPEPKMPSPPGPLETTKTLISLEPSSWRRTQAILGGGGVARAGSGGKGKLLRARPRSPLWPLRAKQNGGDFAGLYIRVPTLHSLLLPLGACSSTSLVRDRR